MTLKKHTINTRAVSQITKGFPKAINCVHHGRDPAVNIKKLYATLYRVQLRNIIFVISYDQIIPYCKARDRYASMVQGRCYMYILWTRALYSAVITRQSNPPLSQFNSLCNKFKSFWAMFLYNSRSKILINNFFSASYRQCTAMNHLDSVESRQSNENVPQPLKHCQGQFVTHCIDRIELSKDNPGARKTFRKQND